MLLAPILYESCKIKHPCYPIQVSPENNFEFAGDQTLENSKLCTNFLKFDGLVMKIDGFLLNLESNHNLNDQYSA